MTQHIGIDLGTTTSGLALLRDDGHPEIVPNADGERLTPSVVYFDKHEGVKLVGTSARDGGDPNRTVHCIKKRMDDPNYWLEFDGRRWTPSEISALILAKLARECSTIVGDIREVVITVPALFNELARKSTVAAAKMAGLKVTRLVNEPTAAALYYAHRFGIMGRILVYDLGGGTLDITILEVYGDEIRILLSEGARHLGGSDFDEIVLSLYQAQFKEERGTDLFSDERQRRRVLKAGEDAKKMLSKLKHVSDTIGNDKDGIAQVKLSRDVFETAVGRLMLRTEMLVEQALNEAGLNSSEIDHIVLVGGSTRIPSVREMLERKFGVAPRSCGNVDECVALGAALFAKYGTQVKEVCNQGYGTLAIIENVETGEEVFQNSIVIPKNTPIPCAESQTYITSEEDERFIEVEITQGEDTDPNYVDVIGKITLEVPPGRPAGCEVTVTYSYDENQRIRALIQDRDSGRSQNVAISYKGEGILTESQVDEMAAYIGTLRIE